MASHQSLGAGSGTTGIPARPGSTRTAYTSALRTPARGTAGGSGRGGSSSMRPPPAAPSARSTSAVGTGTGGAGMVPPGGPTPPPSGPSSSPSGGSAKPSWEVAYENTVGRGGVADLVDAKLAATKPVWHNKWHSGVGFFLRYFTWPWGAAAAASAFLFFTPMAPVAGIIAGVCLMRAFDKAYRSKQEFGKKYMDEVFREVLTRVNQEGTGVLLARAMFNFEAMRPRFQVIPFFGAKLSAIFRKPCRSVALWGGNAGEAFLISAKSDALIELCEKIFGLALKMGNHTEVGNRLAALASDSFKSEAIAHYECKTGSATGSVSFGQAAYELAGFGPVLTGSSAKTNEQKEAFRQGFYRDIMTVACEGFRPQSWDHKSDPNRLKSVRVFHGKLTRLFEDMDIANAATSTVSAAGKSTKLMDDAAANIAKSALESMISSLNKGMETFRENLVRYLNNNLVYGARVSVILGIGYLVYSTNLLSNILSSIFPDIFK